MAPITREVWTYGHRTALLVEETFDEYPGTVEALSTGTGIGNENDGLHSRHLDDADVPRRETTRALSLRQWIVLPLRPFLPHRACAR